MTQITRRHFSLGLLTAGTLAAAKASARGAFPANERIRAAVIGCRIRGPQLAKRVLRVRRLELAALCDCDLEVLAGARRKIAAETELPPRLQAVQDFRRILDDPSIDAVFIATPDHWHAIMMLMALQTGKHVYVEKPASYNIEEGKAMVAGHRKYPRQAVLVGTQQRSSPHFAEARRFVKSGALGHVGFVRAWITNDKGFLPRVPDRDPPRTLDYDLWLGPAPDRPYNENRLHYNWHFMRDTGTGYMGNWGAHWLDVARWFLDLGLPRAVSGHGVKAVGDIKEWPDTHTALYEYPGLTLLWEQRIWTGYALNDKPCGVEFHGVSGALFIDRHGWTFYPKDADRRPVSHPGTEEGMTLRHVEHFAACMDNQTNPASDIGEGHKTAVLCHLGNIAATVGRRIEFDGAREMIRNDNEAAALMSRQYRDSWRLLQL